MNLPYSKGNNLKFILKNFITRKKKGVFVFNLLIIKKCSTLQLLNTSVLYEPLKTIGGYRFIIHLTANAQ
jgi:hypothetical protein